MAVRHWLTLAMTPGLGPLRIARLVERCGSAAAACEATGAALVEIGVRPSRAVEVASAIRGARDQARRQADRASALGLGIVCPDDEEYPPLLREITDPPAVLWTWGRLEARDLHAVAIVGTRRPSGYGKEQAARLAALLARAGLTIVSGGAYGIDTQSHRGALQVMEARTIAVLGCGVDVPYPPENRELFAEIAADRGVRGAVVSELPPGTQPRREHFPRRNRLIAGMARGLLVIEGEQRSGALITVGFANDFGRPVFALPGRVDNPMTALPHRLLREGAHLAAELDDILPNLCPLPDDVKAPMRRAPADADAGIGTPEDEATASDRHADGAEEHQGLFATAGPTVLSDADRRILSALGRGPLNIDSLIEQTTLPAATVSAAVTLLGIKGLLRRRPDGTLERRPGAT